MASERHLQTVLAKCWLGTILTILAGLVFLQPVGDGLARLSFDLPFLVAQARRPDDLVIVYFDDKVLSNLGLPPGAPPPRQLHTRLLQRLTQDGARLVIFDVVFDTTNANPQVDAALAEAMRKNGHVVLAGDYTKELQGNIMSESAEPPIPLFTGAAAAWGIGRVSPDPADNAIRRLDEGIEDYPSLAWAAASASEAPVTREPKNRLAARWLNYYCPPALLHSINLDTALDGLTNGYFKNRVVVIGARPGVGNPGAEREAFPTPYTRFDGSDASGPSIQALSYLNLQQGDWMKEIPTAAQSAVIVSWGFLIVLLLMIIRPWVAICVAAVCFSGFALASCYAQARWHWWFAWMVPAGVQTSVALVWSVGYQYMVESRRRKRLRQAFGAYLSPYMADRIANSEFDLALGGKELEVTVMFTDLEGFTSMSENLPPAEVSLILTSYFNLTTRAILEQDGTIIKYIGDAVLAVWGAPLPEQKHAERAVRAAWGMSQASQSEIKGRRLRTRIGVNTGRVLAGNLGSEFRFDYTLIGNTVNFASRLEGLNKYLRTDVLISEFTLRQIGATFKVRHLGKFLVVGKTESVGVYEALGPAQNFSEEPPWLAPFAQALTHFAAREWEQAESHFRQTIVLRNGSDGPSEFYLSELSRTQERLKPDAPWDGSVLLDSK